jgi:hypothetical protein
VPVVSGRRRAKWTGALSEPQQLAALFTPVTSLPCVSSTKERRLKVVARLRLRWRWTIQNFELQKSKCDSGAELGARETTYLV